VINFWKTIKLTIVLLGVCMSVNAEVVKVTACGQQVYVCKFIKAKNYWSKPARLTKLVIKPAPGLWKFFTDNNSTTVRIKGIGRDVIKVNLGCR
jgi:hypothetical protein